MDPSLKQGCFAAAVIASSAFTPATGNAQSLALSYGLDVGTAPAHRPVTVVSRCTATGALLVLGACNSQTGQIGRHALIPEQWPVLLPASTPNPTVTNQASHGGDLRHKAVASPEPRETAVPELPFLGSSELDGRSARVGGSNDSSGSIRTGEVLFRFGSKYHLRSADEARELSRFTDAASESRIQNSIRVLGLELLFPFQ